jgi:hypothetical protein
MKQFDLDKWLIERYSPLTLERIKKAHFNYDDVLEILNVALRQTPVSGRVCFSSDCFYNDKTLNACVGDYEKCTVKQTHR